MNKPNSTITPKPGSPEYVLLHGLKRRRRGKGPSMPFRHERNPRKAFMLAYYTLLQEDWAAYDPIAQAERFLEIGDSIYPTSNPSRQVINSIAIFAIGHKTSMQNELAKKTDDTTLSNTVSDYIRIVKEEGFEQVLDLPFTGMDSSGDKNRSEHLFIFFNKKDGLLLCFDTYNEKDVNGSHLYYNWDPDRSIDGWWKHKESGGSHGDIWVGHHDGRAGIRNNIGRLRENGRLLSTWVEQPFIWLLHYMDTKEDGYDYSKINAERIALLPQYVQDAIQPMSVVEA